MWQARVVGAVLSQRESSEATPSRSLLEAEKLASGKEGIGTQTPSQHLCTPARGATLSAAQGICLVVVGGCAAAASQCWTVAGVCGWAL